jgi:hypothetical protein
MLTGVTRTTKIGGVSGMKSAQSGIQVRSDVSRPAGAERTEQQPEAACSMR